MKPEILKELDNCLDEKQLTTYLKRCEFLLR